MSTGINSNTAYRFNATYTGLAYMYYSNSNAKTQLETWYTTNIEEAGYSDYVATGDYYCEQAKVKAVSNYKTGSSSMSLYSSYQNANFKCEPDANGYGIVNSNVGLLTYDEVLYAGGYYTRANSKYYLYSSKSYWTMSPAGLTSNNYARVWLVDLNYGAVDSKKNYLRPVINLKADTQVTGTGSSDDHWVVQ